MLGLLRKDLAQLKSFVWLPLTFIVFMGIIWAVRGETVRLGASSVIIFTIICAPHVLTHENQSKTVAVLRALPLHPRVIVGAKFAWLVVFVAVQLALLWIFHFLSLPGPESRTVVSLAWASFGALSLGSLLLLAHFAFRGPRAKWYVAVAVGLAFAVWLAADSNLRDGTGDPSTFFNTGPGYATAAAAGLLVVACAWMWASRIFARRDITEMQ